MYRERVALNPVPTTPTPPIYPFPIGLIGQSEDCYSSDLNGIYIQFPANWTAQGGFLLARLEIERTLELQGISFERHLVPQDAEPMPETLRFTAMSVAPIHLKNIEKLFFDNYGDLFSIRSHPHEKIFFGIIPSWEIVDGGDEYTDDGDPARTIPGRFDLSFDFFVKDSFNIGRKPVIS